MHAAPRLFVAAFAVATVARLDYAGNGPHHRLIGSYKLRNGRQR